MLKSGGQRNGPLNGMDGKKEVSNWKQQKKY